MPTILYYNPLSPPARAVVLLIRYLGLNDIELKQVDITPGKPRDPEYLEKNPLGQVPFLEDNGLYLSESRAIMLYLVDSRAPESSLVGRFPKKRAIIHQRFHYDLGTIGPKAAEVIRGILFGLVSVPTEESMNQFHSKLDYIEQALAKTQWISGDNITLADLSYLANVATYVHCGLITQNRFPNIWAWYERCKTLPGYEENEEGARTIGNVFKSKLNGPIPA